MAAPIGAAVGSAAGEHVGEELYDEHADQIRRGIEATKAWIDDRNARLAAGAADRLRPYLPLMRQRF